MSKKIEYTVVVSLIPIFADRSQSNTSANYYKVLLDDNKQVIKKELSVLHKSINDCIDEVFSEFLMISPEWPFKKLANTRKVNKTVELTFTATMPFMESCNKQGHVVNINEIMSTNMDEYYVQTITSTSPGLYG